MTYYNQLELEDKIVIQEMQWNIDNAMKKDSDDFSQYGQDMIQAMVKVFCFYTLQEQQQELFKKYPQLEQFKG
jgi:hypothetical protein